MNVALLTNIISPHQIPLASEIAKLVGERNYRYIYTEPFHGERLRMGWSDKKREAWCVEYKGHRSVLEDSEVVYCCNRDIPLLERRSASGRFSIYMSERWFKPPIGMLRLVHLKYFLMTWRFVRLLRNSDKLIYCPIGIHAASDMARLCGLLRGDLKCLFSAPELNFEKKPGGRVWLKNGGDGKRYCLDKMRIWGYFVEPSKFKESSETQRTANHYPLLTVKVLWVGRLLGWKRVDTIIRAVGEIARSQFPSNFNSDSNFHIQLDIYGAGPEKARLKRLAAEYGDIIKFHPPVPISEVRKLMHTHDIYILASNGYEGWGAVVSEALEEGMKVIGTYEAGSSATILPESNLFHAGDWRSLSKLLSKCVPQTSINKWTAKNAAKYLATYDKI